jgi:CheY-like chemotaxis protein
VPTVDSIERPILVVEDNAIAREGLAAVLRGRGYTVATAENGQMALDQLAAGPAPAAILLDMFMPEMDGWHFLDWLKGTGHGATPVVITTGSDLTRSWAETHGCAGFLRKPFDVTELFAELVRVIGAG